jgi:hypothetical protein
MLFWKKWWNEEIESTHRSYIYPPKAEASESKIHILHSQNLFIYLTVYQSFVFFPTSCLIIKN